MEALKWEPTMDSDAFIDSIRTKRRAAAPVSSPIGPIYLLELTVDRFFLDSLVALDDSIAERVLQELRRFQFPIFGITMEPTTTVAIRNNDSEHPPTRSVTRRQQRLQRLCETLGSITISMTLPLCRVYPGLADGIASCVRSIRGLSIEEQDDHRANAALAVCPELLAALQGNTSIKKIRIDISTRFYHIVAPIVKNMANLETCRFGSLFPVMTDVFVALNDANAIADLMITSPSLQKLELAGLDLSSVDSDRRLRDGMTHARPKCLEITHCTLRDASRAALALARNSRLEKIQLSQLRFTLHPVSQFMDALKVCAARMLKLNELHLLFEDMEDADLYATMASFIRNANTFPSLSHVQLGCYKYSELLDDALTHCVQHNTNIRRLSVFCPPISNSVRYRLPALCDAMNGNHTVTATLGVAVSIDDNPRNILVREKQPGSWNPDGWAWHSDDKKLLDAVSDLNQNGRVYLEKDATSLSKGIDLLSKVNQKLDPIFYHLRENPLLCMGRSREPKATIARAVGRKRKMPVQHADTGQRKSARLAAK